MPLIDTAVLIPHYNNIDGLRRSLKSIAEPFRVAVVVVDDGSRETPVRQELDTVNPDIDLHLVLMPQNGGIEAALNTGLTYIGEQLPAVAYVARLDCGDENKPNRIQAQRAVLEDHPEIGIVGSLVDFVDMEGVKLFTYQAPAASRSIKKWMYIKNCFIHPAVCFRLSLAKQVGFYPTNYKSAEDYALFLNLLEISEGHIIQEPLVACEVNMGGITATTINRQRKNKLRLILAHKKFSVWFFLGLLWSSFLYFMPYSLTTQLKALRDATK